jgi:AraC family transcriptional regulator of adaptative response / DNA-3-methyladenine glycosylase II
MKTHYNQHEFYRAHLARDPRFDGKFFVAVKTTMIYCRPTCPARKAQLKNLTFYIHATQAEEAGYRPCLRCRPETAPGSPAWLGTSATVQRAIRIMDSLAFSDLSITKLAEKLGVGERWLRDLFQQQVGASPQAILLAKKLDTARYLLDHSSLPITEIALSSGFQSIRRFNDAFKKRFQQSPRNLKKKPNSSGHLRIQLRYRPPYAWEQLINFFKARALTAMEYVEDNSYQRLFTQNEIRGWFKATHCADHKIEIEFQVDQNANLLEFIARIKNIFDLDADPMSIDQSLQTDPKLKPYLTRFKGLRIPGCWDGFELAVRAIIGQKISVKAARTVLNRLVVLCGEKQKFDDTLALTHFFPTPENILAADLSGIGLTTSKIASIKALAHEIVNNRLVLDGTVTLTETCQKLLAIKGIGLWTAEYIAMRALRDPNAFPETDLELQKKIVKLQLDPKKWTPWRAYGAILLWNLPLMEET